MKKVLALALVLIMLLSLTACSLSGVNTAKYDSSLSPTEAAEKAAEATQDKFKLSDVIRVPFGYLMDWLYQLTDNYGAALILFSLIVNTILLPMRAKSKKSMLKMSRLSPLVKALEAKYGDDKTKYQQEVMALYKEEGISQFGGCLWSFVPVLILFPLYYVIREPLTYMIHNAKSVSAGIVAYMTQVMPDLFSGNTFYAQLTATGHLGEVAEELKQVELFADAKLRALNFSALGVDLAQIPTFRFWAWEGADWNKIGLLLIPLISAATQLGSMLISTKMNGQVATNADGEKDEEAAKSASQSNATMFIMGPVMSLWIGYSMPAALSVYWAAQAVFNTIQDYFLTVHYRKIYDAEDAERQERAALRRAEEAEKERQRALHREQNPDGITENVSKKKIKQQEKEAAAAAAREYQARKAAETKVDAEPAETEQAPVSGPADRPYARGRAYRADHYGKKAEADKEE